MHKIIQTIRLRACRKTWGQTNLWTDGEVEWKQLLNGRMGVNRRTNVTERKETKREPLAHPQRERKRKRERERERERETRTHIHTHRETQAHNNVHRNSDADWQRAFLRCTVHCNNVCLSPRSFHREQSSQSVIPHHLTHQSTDPPKPGPPALPTGHPWRLMGLVQTVYHALMHILIS